MEGPLTQWEVDCVRVQVGGKRSPHKHRHPEKEDPSGPFGQRGSLMVRADALLVHGLGREDVEEVLTSWGVRALG